jgi:hypothetical protein
MVELRASWPRDSTDSVAVDPVAFRSYYDSKQFPDPTHGQFIDAITYDDSGDNPTSVAANRVFYDQNKNDIMWVDSEALVDNDRHRILVQVERLNMPTQIPDMALAAGVAGGNSHGLNVNVDPNYTGPIPVDYSQDPPVVGAKVSYGGSGDFKSGVNAGANISAVADDGFSFKQYVPDSLTGVLMQLAQRASPESYFDDSTPNAEDTVANFLCDPDTGPGSIVYYQTKIGGDLVFAGGHSDMGTPQKPLIFVVDARDAINPTSVDLRGNGDFYGVLIVLGDVVLRGTSRQPTGAVFCEGTIENKGGPDVLYNGDYIRKLNDMYTLSVAIVPNTWEEYTIPEGS